MDSPLQQSIYNFRTSFNKWTRVQIPAKATIKEIFTFYCYPPQYSGKSVFKQALKIEENLCGKNNNEDNFFKFHFIYEKL